MGVVGKIWDVVSCQRRSSGLDNCTLSPCVTMCYYFFGKCTQGWQLLNSGVPPANAEKSEGVPALSMEWVGMRDIFAVLQGYFECTFTRLKFQLRQKARQAPWTSWQLGLNLVQSWPSCNRSPWVLTWEANQKKKRKLLPKPWKKREMNFLRSSLLSLLWTSEEHWALCEDCKRNFFLARIRIGVEQRNEFEEALYIYTKAAVAYSACSKSAGQNCAACSHQQTIFRLSQEIYNFDASIWLNRSICNRCRTRHVYLPSSWWKEASRQRVVANAPDELHLDLYT